MHLASPETMMASAHIVMSAGVSTQLNGGEHFAGQVYTTRSLATYAVERLGGWVAGSPARAGATLIPVRALVVGPVARALSHFQRPWHKARARGVAGKTSYGGGPELLAEHVNWPHPKFVA